MEIMEGNIITTTHYKGRRVVGKCFTSNGIVKPNGELVMGAGVAKAFRDTYSFSSLTAGQRVNLFGNHVHDLGYFIKDDLEIDRVISFPTKAHYKDASNIELIIRSCKELSTLIMSGKLGEGVVLLPKPGCHNGGLSWDHVKREITPHLHPDVVIISMHLNQ